MHAQICIENEFFHIKKNIVQLKIRSCWYFILNKNTKK